MCSTQRQIESSRQFSNIINFLINDNFTNKEANEAKKRHLSGTATNDGKKRNFEGDNGDSELRKLLSEPIKNVIARIKTRENGVIYVDFEEVGEDSLNKNKKIDNKENTLKNKENQSQLFNCLPSRNPVEFIKCLSNNSQNKVIVNSRDDNFENIWIQEACIDLDSIDISDCLMVDLDLKLI